ncbi:MAG TPA: DUF3606 domain-containing protein [Burkholderiaceae bacterium]
MSDNLNSRGPQDASRINVHEQWEVSYWTKKFGVTPEQLEQAVKQVGPSAKAVEQHLKH